MPVCATDPRTRRWGAALLLAGVLAGGGSRPLAAAEPPSIAELVTKTCPALLLRPDAATGQMLTLGFAMKDFARLGPKWTATRYELKRPDGSSTSVTLTKRDFADWTATTCQMVAVARPVSDLDLNAVKRDLEADPDIRHLDGDVAALPSGSNEAIKGMAWFKRPGNHPALFMYFTVTKAAVIVAMTRGEPIDAH